MSAFPFRTAALALTAAVGLAACTSPYGYNGVSVGVGSGYGDPYYGSGYDYGYGAGYPGYGYGAGYPGYGYGMGYPGYGYAYAPWGWYDNFYYPGTGYYVYDRYRRPIRWSDDQRRYWEARRKQGITVDAFRRAIESKKQNWDGFEAGPTAVSQPVRVSDGQPVSVESTRPTRTERVRPVRTERQRVERPARAQRTERQQVERPAQQEQRVERQSSSDHASRKAERAERQSAARAARAERLESRRQNDD